MYLGLTEVVMKILLSIMLFVLAFSAPASAAIVARTTVQGGHCRGQIEAVTVGSSEVRVQINEAGYICTAYFTGTDLSAGTLLQHLIGKEFQPFNHKRINDDFTLQIETFGIVTR